MRFLLAPRVRICTTFIMLFIAMFFMSCAADQSFLKQSHDTVYAAAVTYDASLTIAGNMYKAGEITEEQKAEIIKYAHKYKDAIKVVKAALISYKTAEIQLEAEENENVEEDEDELAKAEIVLLNALGFLASAEADLLKLLN